MPLQANTLEVFRDTPPRRLRIHEIEIGHTVVQRLTFTKEMVVAFSDICADYAAVHHDPAHATSMGYGRPIVHGILAISPFSRLIGMHLPGEYAVVQTLELKLRQPVFCDEQLTYRVVVTDVRAPFKIVRLELTVSTKGNHLITGQSQCQILAPQQ
jgi:acyl dehydratase